MNLILYEKEALEAMFLNTDRENKIELFYSADNLNQLFTDEKHGIFCTIFEKSLCIYWHEDFCITDEKYVSPALYIDIEDILPYLQINCWEYQSEAVIHIKWQG